MTSSQAPSRRRRRRPAALRLLGDGVGSGEEVAAGVAVRICNQHGAGTCPRHLEGPTLKIRLAVVLYAVAVQVVEFVYAQLARAGFDLAIAIGATALVLVFHGEEDPAAGAAPAFILARTAEDEIKAAAAIELVIPAVAEEEI